MSSRSRLSRRTVLRGLGATMALPMLEAMSPSSALAASAGATAPKRLAFVFVPNGMHMPDFTPDHVGQLRDLPKTLKPLSKVKKYLSVISGLEHEKAEPNGDGPGDHARSSATFLTGAQARKTSGRDIHVGVSADQIVAQQIGDQTPLPSLELGCEGGRLAGSCDSGYSCAYSGAISWRTPSSPMAKEVNPRSVFERLFGEADKREAQSNRNRRMRYQKSILDFVQEDAKALNRQLGVNDQRKMEEYLEAVRATEKRIEASKGSDPRDRDIEYPVPKGVPGNFGEHIRLMGDLMTLAFQTDQTRVATFMIANEGSNRSYRDVDVREGHHSLSHHGRNQKKMQQIQVINEYHMRAFAHMLEKMASIKEGDGTLLDYSMIVYGCAISDGNRHNHDKLPVLVAGHGGGTVIGDRHVRVDKQPMCNLFLSLFDRMGVKADRFGDSTGRLEEL